ncbi:hypothetical protein [Leptothoe sp. PORK10 BA2]|uniref:hypothetical protein n=1 Tax=Leptothoe sp. PORK10 BA2 TaxID=3110254 RepID=UPI002B1EC5D2|nr:hypothetical protein [Leptothoe sp. PORK10 BA2]MEA5464504.1 hypothetical protein [Leptothoe sp. PORK10 BA2]
MNSTNSHTLADMQAYTAARYTAQEIAQTHNVAESTVRTRWFDWIRQVAPAELLKDDRGYSELARTLFGDFAGVKLCDRNQWVTEAKARYSHEWESAGIIEGELMPEEVGNVLALRQTQNHELGLSVAQQLQQLESLIDQANTAEGNLSDADLKAAVTRGQQRAVMLYQAELQAELQTINSLKQRRMGGGQP